MRIVNFVRIAVALLAVSLGGIAGTAAADVGSTSPGVAKQEVLSVKTLNLRWDQWNHEAGSELKVCPGRFRTIGGEMRCRVPDGGLNGLLGGMVTGESMTAQEAILKLAGGTAKILDITQNGDQNRLQIKFSYQATGGPVSSFTDLSAIATRAPTEADDLAKTALGSFFGVGVGIFVVIAIAVFYFERKSPTLSEREDNFSRLRDEQAMQRPTARVDTPSPLVLQPTAQPAPSVNVAPTEPTPTSGRRLYLD